MAEDGTFRENLIASIPSLRAFAFSLLKDRDRADDIVQDTIVRAWQHRDRFEEGTNFGAWLFTILRNLVYSAHRKRVREVEDADGSYSARLKTHPDQQSHLDFEDFQRALQTIPLDQREALLLVAAEGLSYEEAAEITGVAVGTVKSRVNRARGRLARLLAVERNDDVGPDNVIKAAMQG
ncbi:MAG TPA: sigma-70 family RNA polymerase sigma factor [Microvirga sp.]|jgi:RNA polymerase sigma-70 factor (ECF subfamily)|nr:sigma-70 family RNA polymerase sigma factor [Microvirga sp.]